MATLPHFYVYVLARPDGTPFYVGKGSAGRIADHVREARRGHKCHKCSVIRKIWKQGGEFQCYTVFTTDDEAEAYAFEAETIAMYGLGTLANHTVGGKGGSSGRVQSEEERAKMRASLTKYYEDPAARAKQRQSFEDPTWRAENSARMKQHWADPAARAKQSAAIAQSYGYIYTITAPNGEVFTTDNLNAFCGVHGLQAQSMGKVVSGKHRHHKGWVVTRKKADDATPDIS